MNEGDSFSNEGIAMNEFHVYDHDKLQKLADVKHPEFGGNISVQAEAGAKAMIIFGQNGSIFHQNASITMQWVGPNREVTSCKK
jgi:hypothetical protein